MISFTADRIALGNAIARAAQGLPSRPQQPVYAGLLFAVRPEMGVSGTIVQITASDGEVMFVSAVDAKSDAIEEGSFILPGKVITDVFRYLAGKDVTITFDGATAVIEAGRALYVFTAVDGEKYPAWLADVETKYLGSVDGAEFADLVRFTVPAASRSDSRPTLRTVALSLADETLTLVATDSYRMAAVTPVWHPFLHEEDPPEQVLIPSWVMERFARVCDEEVAIGWDGARVILGTQGLKVVARQIAGKYLDWRKVIAKRENADLQAEADVLELIRAVKAATLVAGEALGIRLQFSKDGHIHIQGKGNGSCDEMIGTDYCGETVTFIIGPQMLLDGLAGCDESVLFRFSSNPLAPVFMEDNGEPGIVGFNYFMQPRANIEEPPGDKPAQ